MVIDLTSSPIKKDIDQGSDGAEWKAKHQPHPYTNSFVDCIGLEIDQTAYGQASQIVAAGLLVSISKKPTLHPHSKIQLEIKS